MNNLGIYGWCNFCYCSNYRYHKQINFWHIGVNFNKLETQVITNSYLRTFFNTIRAVWFSSFGGINESYFRIHVSGLFFAPQLFHWLIEWETWQVKSNYGQHQRWKYLETTKMLPLKCQNHSRKVDCRQHFVSTSTVCVSYVLEEIVFVSSFHTASNLSSYFLSRFLF